MRLFKIFILFTFTFLAPRGALATPAEVEISSCKTIDSGRPIVGEYETFVASYDHITKISVYAAVWPNETLTISLLDNSGTLLLQKSLAADGNKWYTATWGEGFNLTIGNTYRIMLTATGAGSNWLYSENDSCNPTGSAYGISPAIDFNYIAYGYNNEIITIGPGTSGNTTEPANNTSSETTANTSSTTTATSQDLNISTTPVATTTSSIVNPSMFNGQYLDESKFVKLTWAKSTTASIDGYRIFRSEEETTNFQKIGQVKKDVLEFSDTGITEGKKYYYFVRAYKGSTESASSETINVVISNQAASEANTTPAPVPVTADVQASTAETNWLIIGLSTALIFLLAFWTVYRFWWLKRKTLRSQIFSQFSSEINEKIYFPPNAIISIAKTSYGNLQA